MVGTLHGLYSTSCLCVRDNTPRMSEDVLCLEQSNGGLVTFCCCHCLRYFLNRGPLWNRSYTSPPYEGAPSLLAFVLILTWSVSLTLYVSRTPISFLIHKLLDPLPMAPTSGLCTPSYYTLHRSTSLSALWTELEGLDDERLVDCKGTRCK